MADTVARIEQGAKRFTLGAGSLGQVLRFVLAFLLHNDLLGGRLHLFSDGYRSLQDTLLAFFAWHPRVWLVLDWYHVVKKFKEDLSRACRAREVRNRHPALLANNRLRLDRNYIVVILGPWAGWNYEGFRNER